MAALPPHSSSSIGASPNVSVGPSAPRPLLAPPPPVHVRLPWSTHRRAALTPDASSPASSSRSGLAPPPGSSAPFASILVSPPPTPLPLLLPVPDALATATALASAAAWTVARWSGGRRGRRRRHPVLEADSADAEADAARPCLATRAAGALDGGGPGVVVGMEDDDGGGRAGATPPPPPPPLHDECEIDAAVLAQYRSFTRGARLGLVREWAPLAG
jgi:hypothetical protein